MEKIVRRIDLREARGENARQMLRQQWLATNGLGGYASGTISGCVTWRYHGLLIAAMPAPLGRVVMLNHLAEFLRFPDGRVTQIGGEEPKQPEEVIAAGHCITEFRLENQMPMWRYEADGVVLEKSLVMLHGQNTVHVRYRLGSSPNPVQLILQPSLHFRPHDRFVNEPLRDHFVVCIHDGRFEISAGDELPTLRLHLQGENMTFTHGGGAQHQMFYQREADRGYPSAGALWSPGKFGVNLQAGKNATLIASTENWKTILALGPEDAETYYLQYRNRLISQAHPKARSGPPAELVLAADQFIINPIGRVQDAARAHAAGDEVRTVIAGYHWFTDWGRDTMISLEGLTLATGRYTEAGWILRTFAHYIRDGLIPNLFPEGDNEGLYHTADATLWFFHALDRYVEITGDRRTLRLVLPKLAEIVEAHLRGTKFGISVDPQDGLLRQGAEGYQLTWMDAKVEGWVVTPRRGKAVEINGLWYNALRLLEDWTREEHGESAAEQYARFARLAKQAFNQRFWCEERQHLYDIVDGENGDDPALRPNQLLAFSLKHPILDQEHWNEILEIVREKLLTSVGLRTLDRDHPDYKPKYFGDLRARDAAYHQGTVWAWLIGPFVDAWLNVHPEDRAGARKFLEGFVPHLDAGCIGSINEIFDAEPPFTPRGCISQAWSVAEVLRCWIKTAE